MATDRTAEIRARLHEALYGTLIDRIEEDRYPSTTMLNMIEQGLASDEQYAAYVEALLDKVADDRYPSVDMIKRLSRLV
ncbi:MAG TPA: hypothetical protein VFH38_05740 [Jatrophihabitans sp.]|nr:hypothetical protein [Jatrophihabitans sp.]